MYYIQVHTSSLTSSRFSQQRTRFLGEHENLRAELILVMFLCCKNPY